MYLYFRNLILVKFLSVIFYGPLYVGSVEWLGLLNEPRTICQQSELEPIIKDRGWVLGLLSLCQKLHDLYLLKNQGKRTDLLKL
jgi:hypothetical protein